MKHKMKNVIMNSEEWTWNGNEECYWLGSASWSVTSSSLSFLRVSVSVPAKPLDSADATSLSSSRLSNVARAAVWRVSCTSGSFTCAGTLNKIFHRDHSAVVVEDDQQVATVRLIGRPASQLHLHQTVTGTIDGEWETPRGIGTADWTVGWVVEV